MTLPAPNLELLRSLASGETAPSEAPVAGTLRAFARAARPAPLTQSQFVRLCGSRQPCAHCAEGSAVPVRFVTLDAGRADVARMCLTCGALSVAQVAPFVAQAMLK